MNRLKKFWIVFFSFLPFGAGAVAPWLIGAAASAVGIAGFSIYRSMSPVDMSSALDFFSSCWTCDMFSSIIGTMSSILPGIYNGLGKMIVPLSIGLMAVWFAWRILTGFINSKTEEPIELTKSFGDNLLRLAFASVILLAPLPRLISDVAITPIFNVGLYINHVVAGDEAFNNCVIATALADPTTVDTDAAQSGAFSPRLRHNLACELATVHQLTGLGMTTGWTMMNMAFNEEYMHKIMWGVPIFPNVPIFFAGLLVLLLFFGALLPIPLYFLEIFMNLALDLILLPLTILGNLFKDWKIFPKGTHNKGVFAIIDDIVSGTFGIAMTGVFIAFGLIFIDSIFGRWNGGSALMAAISNNDSTIIMDGLMMRNDSLITIILMGVFIAMFMTSIPALMKTLFNTGISTKYYDTVKKDVQIVWSNLQKLWESMKK